MNPYSKKTQDYWHQIKAMVTKLNKFAADNIIDKEEINNIIKQLENLKERSA